MFHSIRDAWLSAAKNNMADVKELIPEFYYLPEFLVNSNNFDFGTKQSGVALGDVVLPAWAKGDSREFIRIHREVVFNIPLSLFRLKITSSLSSFILGARIGLRLVKFARVDRFDIWLQATGSGSCRGEESLPSSVLRGQCRHRFDRRSVDKERDNRCLLHLRLRLYLTIFVVSFPNMVIIQVSSITSGRFLRSCLRRHIRRGSCLPARLQ